MTELIVHIATLIAVVVGVGLLIAAPTLLVSWSDSHLDQKAWEEANSLIMQSHGGLYVYVPVSHQRTIRVLQNDFGYFRVGTSLGSEAVMVQMMRPG